MVQSGISTIKQKKKISAIWQGNISHFHLVYSDVLQ